jgi:hypothetical protein
MPSASSPDPCNRHEVQAAPSARRRSRSVPALRRFAAVTWSLTILVIAVAAVYVAVRDPERYAGAARLFAWEIRDALTPGPPLGDSEAKINVARQGYFQPTLLYPVALSIVIKRADREGRDILGDFEALQAAWRLECGDKPLTFSFVHLLRTEPFTGQQLRIAMNSPHCVTRAIFLEVVPLLREIRTLILAGDGMGRGVLPRSGYMAGPDEDARLEADPALVPHPGASGG